MKVKDVMTTSVTACAPETNLAAATEMLWNADCGILPVVTDSGRVVGMITDRDICIATGTRALLASDIAVRDVISGNVFGCLPDTDVKDALETMRSQKVHRLAVVDSQSHLEGVLSLDDVAARAQAPDIRPKTEPSLVDVGLTLKAISERSRQQLQALTAT